MAAEAYARLGGRPAILNVTPGPGGITSANDFGLYSSDLFGVVRDNSVHIVHLTLAPSVPPEPSRSSGPS